MKIDDVLFEARQFRHMSAPKGFAMWGAASQRGFRKAAKHHFNLLSIAESAQVWDDAAYESELVEKLRRSTKVMRTFYW